MFEHLRIATFFLLRSFCACNFVILFPFCEIFCCHVKSVAAFFFSSYIPSVWSYELWLSDLLNNNFVVFTLQEHQFLISCPFRHLFLYLFPFSRYFNLVVLLSARWILLTVKKIEFWAISLQKNDDINIYSICLQISVLSLIKSSWCYRVTRYNYRWRPIAFFFPSASLLSSLHY